MGQVGQTIEIQLRLAGHQPIERVIIHHAPPPSQQIPQTGPIAPAQTDLAELLRIRPQILTQQHLLQKLPVQRFVINDCAVKVQQNCFEGHGQLGKQRPTEPLPIPNLEDLRCGLES
ncbi:hypothetical protein AMR42_18865 [Limnothrix sp. PR1529]|nr:hypothetical protein AMR42_18865 [Limnothrix sp. PR1529]